MNVVVIGSMNMDYVVNVNKLPKKEETISATSFTTSIGGKGANQAFAAKKLGAEVFMIGAVGNDEAGRRITERMKEENIDTTRIETVNVPTGNAMITVEESGSNTIVVYPGANDYVSKNLIGKNEDVIKEADFIILQLEIPIESVEYAVKLAKKYNKKVILNPAPAKKIPESLYEFIDILTPNETELESLSKEKDIKNGAKLLLHRGVKEVVVTIGDKGCYYLSKEDEFIIDSIEVNAIDTTAAGDSFNGALAVGLCEGKSMKETLKFANIVGALTTTKHGAESSLPNRMDVDRIYINL